MTIWKRIPLPLKILVPGLMLAWIVVTMKPKPSPSAPPETIKIPEVHVIHAEPKTHFVWLSSQGNIEPRREIDLITQVSGVVTQVSNEFVEGGYFKQGDVLLHIDDADYRILLARAEASLATAKVELAQEKGRTKQAKKEWRDLGDADANDLFLRKPQRIAAEKNVDAAKADVAQAKLNIQRTKITAPFTGRIRNHRVDLGQFINQGTVVATIFDTSSKQVNLPLSSEQAALIELPLTQTVNTTTPVTLEAINAGATITWQGNIVRTVSAVDTTSRLLSAIIDIPKEQKHNIPLLVGTFVTAKIRSQPQENTLKLPREAIVKRNQVFIIRDDRTVIFTAEVLARDDNYVWIRQGDISAGTPIIIDNQNFLTSDMAVKIKNNMHLPNGTAP